MPGSPRRKELLKRRKARLSAAAFLFGARMGSRADRLLMLEAPLASMVFEGDKISCVFRNLPPVVGRPVFLGEDGRILGVVLLEEPEIVNRKELQERENEHHISEKHVARRWKKAPDRYYLCKVFPVVRFPADLECRIPRPQKFPALIGKFTF